MIRTMLIINLKEDLQEEDINSNITQRLIDRYENYDEPYPEFTDALDEGNLNAEFNEFIDILDQMNCSEYIRVNPTQHTIAFLDGMRNEFFKKQWKYLKGIISNEDSYKAFTEDYSFVRTLKNFIDDDGMYVIDQYGSYETLDSFIRNLEYNKEYQINGAILCHS